MAPQARRSSYDLVSFNKPPVAEVVLSAQFAPDTIDVGALGVFSRMVRARLPIRQRQPQLPPMLETFDVPPTTGAISIHLEQPASLPRFWFMSKDRVELVQLQHDRLTLNWRQIGAASYPRYPNLRRRFREVFTTLTKSLAESAATQTGPVSLPVNLCEVAYVNPVEYPIAKGSRIHPDPSKIIARLRPQPRNAFLPRIEDMQLQARWRIPAEELGRKGQPAGRLVISMTPALKPPDQTPIYLLNLTARLTPTTSRIANVLTTLDVGHKWVVLGFRDITTPLMQEQWGILKEDSV